MNVKWRGGIALVAMIAIGCGEDSDDNIPDPNPQDTGLALAIGYLGDSDVEGFEIEVRECGGGTTVEETRGVSDLVVPGRAPDFVDGSFTKDPNHLFADYFTNVDPGCYDVEVSPVTRSGTSSNDCDPTTASEVFVVDKKTTEIVMISPCGGNQLRAGTRENRLPEVQSRL